MQLFLHYVPGSLARSKECLDIVMVLLCYPYDTHSFSGLIPARLRKAGAYLGDLQAFSEEPAPNYPPFLGFPSSFACLECRDGTQL